MSLANHDLSEIEQVEVARSENHGEPRTALTIRLVGEDGNAFAILGRAKKLLERNGLSDLWPKFQAEATSSDYNHLLMTCFKWFHVEGFDA